jgi:hypothetical protein
MEKEKIIEIYSGTIWESELVKSLLQSANIESFLRNTVLNSYAYEPIIAEGVKVMISYSDFDEAIKIVNKFITNR